MARFYTNGTVVKIVNLFKETETTWEKKNPKAREFFKNKFGRFKYFYVNEIEFLFGNSFETCSGSMAWLVNNTYWIKSMGTILQWLFKKITKVLVNFLRKSYNKSADGKICIAVICS